ncbi:MAG: LEA type 2 family protein [Gemmatimonadaceae bacterium]
MRKALLMWGGAAAVALTSACATLGMRHFKEPVVTFKDVKVTGLGIAGGSMEIVLDVYNPNNFRLDGSRLTYKLMVDSVTFGTGAYDSRFQVEKDQSSEIRLPFSFTYAGVGAAGQQLMQTGSVEYRVLGDVTVNTPIGSFTRPYDQRGRFNSLSR